MKTTFDKQFHALKAVSNRFDENSNQQKLECLKKLSEMKLPLNKALISYFDLLLFICGYPSDEKLLATAENELLRITRFQQKERNRPRKLFVNSGLPYSKYVSRFSHDCVNWLLTHPNCNLSINGYEDASLDLNEVLRLTLPSVERSETTAGLSNIDLLETLMVEKKNQLPFLITELSKLESHTYVKDQLFDGLGIHVGIQPKDKTFSRAYNRLQVNSVYFHKALIKQFNYETLLNTELPKPVQLSVEQLHHAILTVKNSMALTDRETDPTTYLDSESFRLYELESGISIAIYGMIPQRQLPLESYVGYTLFKNGFPAAYGGGWVFGERSNFGINIFEAFRGGESGYMMCQLLRVYRQVFNVNYFEVEPYQFGLENPEGITSGAFWFYFRYGFRPLDKELLKISLEEQKKIQKSKTYRTSRKTLIKFTDSNIALNLGKRIPVKVPDLTSKVIRMMSKQYKDNRLTATDDCVKKFIAKTGLTESLNLNEKQVLQEVALWAEAFGITENDKLNMLVQMVKAKPIDLYKYQQLLLNFFSS